ncbi:hypothetical protein [Staphylococcus hominis]|uniref:hypothetical protein n=1 Tax=Staphylococcus hominis TaxID=1290 RepID=UPI001F5A7306|nr:hypothetical protein [Staphylococcus hominis]MCI2848325.1 hypothetical protein [Staphylococcus hominis]MCI2849728.1 hypothetical protein [Staphylococcus hominis]MCI2855865.1 hypothetical protein [Staphylococcus hominis]
MFKKLTLTRSINIGSIIVLLLLGILVGIKTNNITKIDGTDKAIEAYINFSSITVGFFATVISILTVLIKQKFFSQVMSKKSAKSDFIFIGVMTISCGFISLVLAVILSFIIGNGKVNDCFSNIIGIVFLISAIMYVINLMIFLLVTLVSIFSDLDQVDSTK